MNVLPMPLLRGPPGWLMLHADVQPKHLDVVCGSATGVEFLLLVEHMAAACFT